MKEANYAGCRVQCCKSYLMLSKPHKNRKLVTKLINKELFQIKYDLWLMI